MGSLASIDRLVYGPPAKLILGRMTSTSIVDLSHRAITDLSNLFETAEMGNSSWNFAYSYLRDAGRQRRQCLERALTKPVDEILSELQSL